MAYFCIFGRVEGAMDMLNMMGTGLFTGFGVIAGQWFFERFIKHRLDRMSRVLNKKDKEVEK